jgi:ADP-L-glycero-D-manno-heptose 6-epimerase
MYIVVTGAAGLVGSNIVKALNERGIRNIIAVDNLTRADKFRNLVGCDIVDYLDKHDFIERIQAGHFDGEIDAVFHQGACSDPLETDGRYIMENNYRYSMILLDWCQDQDVQFLYASSAAIYGAGNECREERQYEVPLDVHGYSRFLFDQVVRQRLAQNPSSQVVGLRYFNVYGPGEAHKGPVASFAYQCFGQLQANGKISLGKGGQGDFVFVGDVARVNLYFLDHPEKSGIFNLGSGAARSFDDVANATVNGIKRAKNESPLTLAESLAQGLLEYVACPETPKGKYPAGARADLTRLREAGYDAPMTALEEGVSQYVEWLQKNV